MILLIPPLFFFYIATLEEATPNLSVIEDYRRRLVEYNERKTDLDAVTAERDASKSQVEILRKKRLDEFMAGFSIISQKLKEMYQVRKNYTLYLYVYEYT